MMKRFFIPVLLVLLTIAGALYWLFAAKDHKPSLRERVRVEHYRLSNGLELVLMPNDRLSAVTHLLMVKAGGADDPYGKSGLAHYLEHLLFAGTKEYPEGSYDRAIARLGGQQNAYTTTDYTAYYATVPKDALAQVMAMESDRLQHLEFTDTQAKRELSVITEERNTRVENRPAALFSEQLGALTFLNHPYGTPLIGWPDDMASFNAEDARQFFQTYYRASNMVVVVAGDIDSREVRRLAQRYYGGLVAGKPSARLWPKEPPWRMSRRATMEDATVREPRLYRTYVTPPPRETGQGESMAISVLAQYLGGGPTSLLYRTLVVERKLASSVSAGYNPLRMGPSTLDIGAIPAPGVTLEQLEHALDEVIATALAAAPSDADMARAKTQLKAEIIYAQDGLMPLAQLIGSLVMIGEDEQYFYAWPEAIESVDASAVLAAARKLLPANRRVTGFLLPVNTGAAPPPAAAATATPSLSTPSTEVP